MQQLIKENVGKHFYDARNCEIQQLVKKNVGNHCFDANNFCDATIG